jgi:plastocyanin
MPDRVGSLTSKFATAPSETIELSFPSNVPTGTYKGYCVPHLAMGMKIDITVR